MWQYTLIASVDGGLRPGGPFVNRHENDEVEMELLEGIMTTRAMRRYTDEPVGDAEIMNCLRAAVQAPSGGNNQRYEFVVVTEPDLKGRVADLYLRAWNRYERAKPEAISHLLKDEGKQQQENKMIRAGTHLAHNLGSVAVLVFVVMPSGRLTLRDDEGEFHVGPRYASVFPAVQNFILACRAANLGTVLTTAHWIYHDEMRALLGIPDDHEIVAMLPVGRPTGRWGVAPRKPAEELTGWQQFRRRRRTDEIGVA